MKDFIKKANELLSLRESVEEHVWKIFTKYIVDTYEGISHYPDGFLAQHEGWSDWEVATDEPVIYFSGDIGCCGYCEYETKRVPFEFFVDYDKALKKMKDKKIKQLEKEAMEKKIYDEKQEKIRIYKKEKRDKKEYIRLKNKFEK